MRLRAVDDVKRGEDRRRCALTITPAPSPWPSPFAAESSVSIWTSDGRICWYTVAEVAGADRRSSIAFFTTPEAILPACASSSGGGDESRLAT